MAEEARTFTTLSTTMDKTITFDDGLTFRISAINVVRKSATNDKVIELYINGVNTVFTLRYDTTEKRDEHFNFIRNIMEKEEVGNIYNKN